jgi:hypothetical protein
MKPREDYSDPIHGAISEIFSAMSALNMEPCPVAPSELPSKGGVPVFLSECDVWAKHSMEHLQAALAQLNKVSAERDSLRSQLYSLTKDKS